MKLIVSLLLAFVLLSVRISTVYACTEIRSPWYDLNFKIDTNVIPSNIGVTYTPYPTLTNTSDRNEIILMPDLYGYHIEGYPTGYVPVYRFSKDTREKFNSYTKNWEPADQVIIYSDYVSPKIPHYYDSGFGRPENNQPQPSTVDMYLYHENKILVIPIHVSYSLNPLYDPYLEKRPDVLCGTRIAHTPVLAQLMYFVTMSLNLVNIQNTRSILSYDLSHQDGNAYFFVGSWMFLVGLGVYLIVRKRKGSK